MKKMKKNNLVFILLSLVTVILLIALYLHLSFSWYEDEVKNLPDLTTWEGAELKHSTPERATHNSYLAESGNSIGHTNPAQQDTFYVNGPIDETRELSEEEKQYLNLGPGHFGALYTAPYGDGTKVMWSNGFDRVVKINHDTFETIDTMYYKDKKNYSLESNEKAIEKFNTTEGLGALANGIVSSGMFKDLSGIYTLLDKDNNYYVGGYRSITVYGDSRDDDPLSAIEVKGVYNLPEEINGTLIGMNMTYDGWLVLATELGYVMALSRDFSKYYYIRLPGAEIASEFTDMGYGWIRNGMAIDENNNIYIASNETLHKVVWTGEKLSSDEKDGAWNEPYSNLKGVGTGATPTLMGFGEEDKFVVITDGDIGMNVVLFWRDDIPDDWKQIDGMPSRRIAGSLPVSMGPLNLDVIQSEQSVVVNGYGALVVNNEVNRPWWINERAGKMLQAFYSGRPEFQPFGMSKFVWNPNMRTLEHAWVNIDVSSPNAVPAISENSGMVYTIGARDGLWTMEAVNWFTGESEFHYYLGDERYNSCYSAVLLDDNGFVMYGTTFGKVKIVPSD